MLVIAVWRPLMTDEDTVLQSVTLRSYTLLVMAEWIPLMADRMMTR